MDNAPTFMYIKSGTNQIQSRTGPLKERGMSTIAVGTAVVAVADMAVLAAVVQATEVAEVAEAGCIDVMQSLEVYVTEL